MQIPKQFASALPADLTAARRITRQRQHARQRGLPSPPETLVELVDIPESVVTIEWGGVSESLVKGDSGPGEY
jgi:hypothetical protein